MALCVHAGISRVCVTSDFGGGRFLGPGCWMLLIFSMLF